MRFGQKIFLIAFILIIISINLIGIIMINYTYQMDMEKEIEKDMIQINSIMAEVENGIANWSNIANIYLKNDVYIELYKGGKKVYTNFKEEYPQIEEKLLTQADKKTSEEIYYSNTDVLEEPYIDVYIEENKLFMKMRKDAQVIVTLFNISEINDRKQEQVNYFVKLSLTTSFNIALFLSFSVSFATRKIKKLNKVVEEVEKGNYSAKIEKCGNDEIGNVAESFNKMTTAIQNHISQIQEVSENRKRFIGNLTHEIRTPLTSIVGYSSLIKNKKATDEKVILEYCNRIYEEGKYIEKISQKLMDLLLLENGHLEIEKIDLSKELNNIIEELQEVFPNVVYEKEITPNVFLDTDKILLKSLIVNLVKNAIRAYEKEPVVRIELSPNKEIKIIDYGKGIPASELEKIKEPFYTLSKDRNRKTSGMGLGLPLCIKIIEMQQGTLEIQSKENVGTEITIKWSDKNERKGNT